MTLFEQIKAIPKVDMHINLTSSISTDLAFDLSDEENMAEILAKMQEKNPMEYVNALKLPVKILKTGKNIILAVNDLIDKLINNNVIYGELFLDLPLYNHRMDVSKLLDLVLSVIKEREINLQVVLVASSKLEKEENLAILELFETYYGNGVNGIYFSKDKMDNLADYMYLFDRLIDNNYPYILNMNTRITSTDHDIYLNAKRIIYALDSRDDAFLDEVRENEIMLEFALTRFYENNLFSDYKEYFIYDLMKENIKVTITSMDMTTLNTDIINEWCILFNNYPLVLHDMIKMISYNLSKANINDETKNKLISEFRDKSNLIL
jgi:adenosine deaminase